MKLWDSHVPSWKYHPRFPFILGVSIWINSGQWNRSRHVLLKKKDSLTYALCLLSFPFLFGAKKYCLKLQEAGAVMPPWSHYLISCLLTSDLFLRLEKQTNCDYIRRWWFAVSFMKAVLTYTVAYFQSGVKWSTFHARAQRAGGG